MVERNDTSQAIVGPGKDAYKSRDLRPVTVMFCDIVNSTVLARQLDVEDFQDLVTQFRGLCAEITGRAGGEVVQTAGDSVLASFGHLTTREDDAERALKTALNIVQALRTKKIGPNRSVEVRVGIATGVVAIDDGRFGIDGEAAHLAARLTKWAEPGSVLIDARTHALTEAQFDCTDLGSQQFKGFEDPMRLWRVERLRSSATLFDAKARFGLTPFVNRERELSTLLNRWADVCAGKGWVVLLSGEPGIGKSRITSELQQRIGLPEEQVLRLQCLPDHRNTALHPIVDQLQRTLGLTHHDPMTVALSKVVTFVESWSKDVSRIAQLYAVLLSIPDEHLGRIESDPDKLRIQTEAALLEFLIDRSTHAPVLLVVEDLHWADPTTISLLDAVVAQAPGRRMMVVSTFRDNEFAPPWPPGQRLTHLKLEQLGRQHRDIFVQSLVTDRALSSKQHEIITSRSGGIPLFLEELTKSLVELGDDKVMPSRIEAILHTRLDRLGKIAIEGLEIAPTLKDLAQVAAVIGWEFSPELLEEVLAPPPDRRLGETSRLQLESALQRLVDSELIRKQGEAFQFKHVLVQEEAYLSMAKKKRDRLHARIASLLNDRDSGYRPAPELAAYHCHEAGLLPEAIRYWREAGHRSARRSSNQEAEHHLRQAIAASNALPDRLETLSERLSLYNELGPVLMASKGFAAPAVVEVYEDAVRVGARIGRPSDLYFPALAGLQLVRIVQGRHREARQMGEECLAIAYETKDPVHLIEAYRHRGATLFWSGEIAKSRSDFGKLIDIYDPDRHSELKFVYGTDPKVSALGFLSMAAGLVGDFRESTARGRQAFQHVHDIGHRHSDSFANLIMALSLDLRREQHEANERSLASMQVGLEIPFWGSWAKIISGRTLLASSPRDGLARIEEGISDYRKTGAGLAETYFVVVLAQALAANGEIDKALQHLEEGLALTERGGERFYEAELLRWKGELLLKKGADEADAETCFQTAMAVAEKQGAKLFELRAALGLFQLASLPERIGERRARVASILARMDNGARTPDVIDAERLLGIG